MMLSPHASNNIQSTQDQQQQTKHQQSLLQRSQTYLSPSDYLTVKSQLPKDLGNPARFPFGPADPPFGLGSALAMQPDLGADPKSSSHGISGTTSSALNTADMQFSGYLLNGQPELARAYYSGQNGGYPYADRRRFHDSTAWGWPSNGQHWTCRGPRLLEPYDGCPGFSSLAISRVPSGLWAASLAISAHSHQYGSVSDIISGANTIVSQLTLGWKYPDPRLQFVCVAAQQGESQI
ncbi:hypothetical protein DL89DRAFT_253750 [Linderina pennispora]|uniref:Uncharacterized protein n=1 Tax=Linderina pennispora TaxID=61395 RepID=A0A1Y1WJR1_9FUNG|nr:uncharacterized protein DL89DRAFT_253750 [Linderina pennispora]ORX73821.1 hypothetical protein DL89DRAFT_253750 [Linderina pennispora]